MNTFDLEEYSKLPTFDIEKPSLNLKGTDFNALIKKTAFAASDSEIRPILTGVYLSLEGDCMTLVSTDSHRLGQVKTKTDNEKSLKLVIPAKALDDFTISFSAKYMIDALMI